MKFKPGKSGNEKGRPRKPASYEERLRNVESRRLIEEFVIEEIRTLKSKYNQLEPKEQLAFLKDIIPYVMPKYSSIDFIEQNDASAKSGFWSEQFEQLESKLKKVG